MVHNIILDHNAESDSSYSLEDALREFGALGQRSFMNAVAFGMKVIETSGWFANATDVVTALNALDEVYRVAKTGERSAIVISDIAHPSTFDYGILYGIISKFRDDASSQIVVRRGTTELGTRAYYLAW